MKKKVAKKNSSVFQFSHHAVAFGANASRTVTIGELIFSDPSSRNSLKLESARELSKFLPQIEKSCDALIFRSEGRVFCSGGNLKDHLAQGASGGKAANREIAAALSSLSTLKIPTIAMIEGDALGGGLELLSAFDVVMSAPHVLFGFWQRRLGLSFGWGGGARLARRLGSPARLATLALESRALTATEARDAGLVDRINPTWSLRSEVLAEALRLASLPRVSVAAMKALRAVPRAEALIEQRSFEKLWFGETHRQRLESFAKR